MFIRLICCMVAMQLHMRCVKGAVCKGDTVHVSANTTIQSITSPNYPKEYFNNELCRWLIEAEHTYEVVRFRVVDSQMQRSATCGTDYAEVKDGDHLWTPTIRRWCGDRQVDGNLTSMERAILVTFRTDGDFRYRGFKMEYWTVPKGEIIYTKAKMEVMNYLLFGIFFVIVSSIIFSLLLIAILLYSNRNGRRRQSNLPPSPTAEVGELHARRRFSRITSMSSAGGRPRSGPSFSISTGPSTPTPRTLTTPV